jgi:hypothetical protein
MSELTLYERTAALVALDALIGEADGEITPEQEAQLAELTGSVTEKAEAVAAKRQELAATAAACTAEAARLTARAKNLTARATWLDGYLLAQLTLAKMTRVDGSRFTISRVVNPPKVVVTAEPPTMRADLDTLPDALKPCVRIIPPAAESYEWDKVALGKLAKDTPEAVEAVAFITRSERIKIS